MSTAFIKFFRVSVLKFSTKWIMVVKPYVNYDASLYWSPRQSWAESQWDQAAEGPLLTCQAVHAACWEVSGLSVASLGEPSIVQVEFDNLSWVRPDLACRTFVFTSHHSWREGEMAANLHGATDFMSAPVSPESRNLCIPS